MANIKEQIGEVVRNLRLESALSQDQLAQRCGIKRSYIGTIERGEKAMTVETASKLAEGLGVKLSTIFCRVEEFAAHRDNRRGV